MAGPENSRNVPFEPSHQIPGVPLDSIVCTEELRTRPSRSPEYEKENRALAALAGALADSQDTILQTLADKVFELLHADSAGLSLLTKDERRFYWAAVAGAWRSHLGADTPRNFGPCGDVLNHNRPMLFAHWERRYPYLSWAIPLADEGLLVPFYVNGRAVGTIWAIAHGPHRKFDAEDLRLLESMSRFASAAYQAVQSIENLKSQIDAREKAEAAVRELASGLETQVRLRTEELEQRNRELTEARARLAEEKLSLERSQAYLSEGQRLSRTGSWRLTVSTGEVLWSQELFAIFGFDPKQTTPSYSLNFERIHPEDRARVEQNRAAAIQEKKDFDVEYRILLPDGSIKHAHSIGHCQVGPSGDLEYIGTVMDVTARKQAEEALRKSERKLWQAIDTIPALVWCNLPDGPNEFLNKGWHEYTGLSPEESHGWGWQAAFHPDDLAALMEKWRRMLVSGVPDEVEARLRRHDGVYRWFLIRAEPLRDEAGKILRWYGTSTDIDDRKRAEDALRRSEAFLAEGQRLSLTGSFSWRLATDEIRWSEQLYRIYELEIGMSVTLELIRTRVHPEDLTLLEKMIEHARSGGKNFEWQYRLLMPDHSIKYMHAVTHAIRDQNGQLEYIATVQDVTARRLSEEARDKARSELAHVARVTSLGALAASIAHEVNQPLSGIVTNASTCLRMLSSDPPNGEGARETARRMIRDGNRASDVITRLRALFSKKDVSIEAVDLNDAVQEVIALSLGDLRRNRVILIAELAGNLPAITGDRVQLQQVILNLLRNASEAMSTVDDRPRELLIRTKLDEGDHVGLSVKDVGPGFHPQTIDRLFDAFYTTKSDGMGIGLSVSRSIVENHHGRLWASLNDGPGSTFSFSIPCRYEASTATKDTVQKAATTDAA